jgi:hypothetical protein
MKEVLVELVLTGANAGRTGVVGRLNFVDGKARFQGTPEAVNGRVIYMGRCYGAYPKGSPQLAEAQRIAEEQANGVRPSNRQTSISAGRPDEIPNRPTARNGVELAGGITDPDAVVESTDAGEGSPVAVGDSSGPARVLPGGSGHSDTGLHEGTNASARESSDPLTLTDAIMSLDPDLDEHWTPDGRPSVSALADLTDNPKLSRRDVEGAGHWMRKDAAEAKIPV